MKFAFQKMQLEADGFYKLINTWAEMQLVVAEDSATIIGYGYTYEIAGAFTMLVFDWEASIPIAKEGLNIPEGSYDLSRMGDKVHACSREKAYFLPDRPVTVEVVSVPEE
ncbi:MAG: hypothetical protein H6559_20775 [Lewinellaceae bacterium]|nr:hypothetical protein [Lewinellaceae bacterium]